MVVGLVSVSSFLSWPGPVRIVSSTTTYPQVNLNKHPITLVNFSLCAVGSDCAYPAPYLSGVVRVQSNVPIVNFHLFINGTDEGIIPAPTVLTTSVPSGGTLNYGISIKAQPSNPNMPIKAGNSYWIMIVANFMDNTESSASTLVIAS
jgi:hypothetical protein